MSIISLHLMCMGVNPTPPVGGHFVHRCTPVIILLTRLVVLVGLQLTSIDLPKTEDNNAGFRSIELQKYLGASTSNRTMIVRVIYLCLCKIYIFESNGLDSSIR